MLMRLGRLADRFSAIVVEGPHDPNALLEEGDFHPVGVLVAAVVLAVSVVAFATGMALMLDHLTDGALVFTTGQTG